MENRYFLHGDRAPDGNFYCAFCDIFADERHFSEHAGNGKRRIQSESEMSVLGLERADFGGLLFVD